MNETTRLSPKEIRKIGAATQLIFSVKGFRAPGGPEDPDPEPLSRMVMLEGHRMVMLTDRGSEALDEIVSILHRADPFEGLASYGDIWSACKQVIQNLLSKNLKPDDGAEYVSLATQIVREQICVQTFVVALFGVALKDADELALGSFRVVRPSLEFINGHNLDYTDDQAARFLEVTQSYLWLSGSVRGTDAMAKKRFRERAQLVTGMIAVVAASMYERGARGFRIGIAMSPEEMYGKAQYIWWREPDKNLAVTHVFTRAQQLKIDAELRLGIETSDTTRCAFRIFESPNRTELEEAIVRAIHWYSDAHRDETPVMRLLKYWSCIEVFFSGSQQEVTKTVSIGVAAVLTHGDLNFLDRGQYRSMKKQVAELYDKRSKAAHGAAYAHVTENQVADLSQWVSWLILSMIVFAQRGAKGCSQVVEWAWHVDARNVANAQPELPSSGGTPAE